VSFYDDIGGAPVFAKLVREFYRGVADDPPLRELYPEEDLGPAEDRLRMFLEQYFGGPHTYSDQRGHPRLRMRHLPYAVTPLQRDRWLRHMLGAVATLELSREHEATLVDYLVRAAYMLVNADDRTEDPA
jgi:hemoglobin